MTETDLSAKAHKTRKRRTKAEMQAAFDLAYEIIDADKPTTGRHVYYCLVTRNEIEKTQNAYKMVGKDICRMRESGMLPYEHIVDNTRWMRKPRSHSSLASMLHESQACYRRALWDNQDVYVEIWCESDSAAGVLYPVTSEWDVALMPAKGFSSDTFIYNSAKAIEDQGKPTFIYYFGDFDPSGVHIDRNIISKLRRHAPGAEIHFERVAVTAKQIEEWNLPGSPPKKTDSRSKKFKGLAVEIEAIPANQLREICRQCIVQHVDEYALAAMERIERQEKELLDSLIERIGEDE